MSKLVGDAPQRVRDVMTPNPITVTESATVHEAALVMREADVGDVLVVRDGDVCGIVTDRDIVVRLVADAGDPTTTIVGEICSAQLTEVAPDDLVEHAIALMRSYAIRRLPVVGDSGPVGIVSLGDLAAVREPSSALADISMAPANT
jgi:CBS domain-containing protein